MEAALSSVAQLDFHPSALTHPSPSDWRDQVIYFLLVDRFDDNRPSTLPYQPAVTARGRDSAAGGRFQGGTLKGVTRRLDYIRELGCTAIWLSPIFRNRLDRSDSYHGYGIQNFLEVDPRFGTLEDLKQLTSEAHQRGMYVILDIIINHTGDVWSYPGGFPYYYSHGERFPFGSWRESNSAPGLQSEDAVWPIEIQKPEAFKREGEIRNWMDMVEARDGDFLSLKELDINRPDVVDTLIKVYKYWIAEADIDGFRVDTVKHMESSTTAIICNALREYAQRIGKSRFFIFGEIVAGDEVIQTYIGRNSRIDGTRERFPSLDAALDFPLYFALEDVIKGFASPELLRQRYEAFHTRYADHGEAGRYFVTFVENHDQISRPYRRFMHDNPYPRQAVLAMGYLLTSTGVPCIYYGSEQGFDGGGDNDSYVRECMFGGEWGAFNTHGAHFFNPNHPIYRGISEIAAARRQEPALRYGRQYFREISGNGLDFGHPTDGHCTLAYSRILDSDEILIAMNLENKPREDFITVDLHLSSPGSVMRNLLAPHNTLRVENSHGRACVRIPLPPHGMVILKSFG